MTDTDHAGLKQKKQIISWILYDFANSAFTTLIVTFIYATYFVKAIAPDEISGTALWSKGITISALCVAFLSPLLGAVADQAQLRKTFLMVSTLVCVSGSALLFLFQEGQVWEALTVFIIANIAFELTNVFYNAFLPEITPKTSIGKISGFGWGTGYVGGLLAMAVAMVAFVQPDVPWFGFTRQAGENIRATNLLVAVWFALFSIPCFLFVRQNKERTRTPVGSSINAGFKELLITFKEIRKYREIVKLLIARLVYNDGLVTIFAFGGIYAAGTFGFTFDEIMIFGILINICAGIGAFIMGYVDDRIGGKKTIQISNIALALASLIAVLAPDKTWFWVASVLVGLFSGPNQSASRSLLGRFVPREKENQFFGFFAFSGKLTAFAGPLLLGLLTQIFNSQRAGVSIVVLFFIGGGLLLTLVDEEAGIKAAVQKN